jgi:hypothetical protein
VVYFLEFDPITVRTPVAAPLLFAPPILVVVGPIPIVARNVEPEVGLGVVFLLNMPAVTQQNDTDYCRAAG